MGDISSKTTCMADPAVFKKKGASSQRSKARQHISDDGEAPETDEAVEKREESVSEEATIQTEPPPMTAETATQPTAATLADTIPGQITEQLSKAGLAVRDIEGRGRGVVVTKSNGLPAHVDVLRAPVLVHALGPVYRRELCDTCLAEKGAELKRCARCAVCG